MTYAEIWTELENVANGKVHVCNANETCKVCALLDALHNMTKED